MHAAVLFASMGLLQGAGIKVPLRLSNDVCLEAAPHFGGHVLLELYAAKPTTLRKEFKAQGRVRYLSFTLGEEPRLEYAAALVEEGGTADLYLDQNLDGELNEPPIELGTMKGGAVSVLCSKWIGLRAHFLMFDQAGQRRPELCFPQVQFRYTRGGTVLQIYAASAYAGTLAIDGQDRKVAWTDLSYLPMPSGLSLNVRLGEQRGGGGDLWIDLDGDGQFDGAKGERFGPGKPLKLFGRSFEYQANERKDRLELKPTAG